MHQTSGRITAHSLEPLGAPSLIMQFPESLSLRPGQFVMGYHPGDPSATRHRLFPIHISPAEIILDRVPHPTWLPGQVVDILGPIGNDFTPPANAGHWLILSLGSHPERLLPLLDAGHALGVSIAFWSKVHLPALPPFVERLVGFEEALDWADFIAIECPGPGWSDSVRPLRQKLMYLTSVHAQALIDVPTPCALGACQACVIPGRAGWHLGCKQGLVRHFDELDF